MTEPIITKWQERHSYYLAKAEEGFFANDRLKEHHYSVAARQWRYAIEELKKKWNGCK